MTTPPLSLLADLARAASHSALHNVRWFRIDRGVFWSPTIDGRDTCVPQSYADCYSVAEAEFVAAASPSVVLKLVGRVRSLEAEQEAYYQRAQEIGETYAAEIAETKRQAARIAELEAMQDKQALYITHLVMQIRGHDWHEEIMATRARIAELESGLREACETIEVMCGDARMPDNLPALRALAKGEP